MTLKLLLINSCSYNPFIAFYADSKLLITNASDFQPDNLTGKDKNSKPDKLIQCLEYVLRKSQANYKNVDAISVVIGPGSFTGIRIGLSIAKGLSLALEKKIIPVDNFDIVLNRLPNLSMNNKYCILLPAKLPEYYYRFIKDNKIISSGCIEISNLRNILDSKTCIVGDFDDEYEPKLNYFDCIGVRKLKSEAESFLELTIRNFENGRLINSEELKPLYIKDFIVKKTLI